MGFCQFTKEDSAINSFLKKGPATEKDKEQRIYKAILKLLVSNSK